MRTSYSAIQTYLQCPKRYEFQDIQKIRVPKSREAIFGTLIHSTLHFMFQQDPLFPTLEEVVAAFRDHHRVNPIPVIDENRKVVGVVSRFDVLKPLQALARHHGHNS